MSEVRKRARGRTIAKALQRSSGIVTGRQGIKGSEARERSKGGHEIVVDINRQSAVRFASGASDSVFLCEHSSAKQANKAVQGNRSGCSCSEDPQAVSRLVITDVERQGLSTVREGEVQDVIGRKD